MSHPTEIYNRQVEHIEVPEIMLYGLSQFNNIENIISHKKICNICNDALKNSIYFTLNYDSDNLFEHIIK